MSVGHQYLGEAGRRYFAWQQESGLLGAELNAPMFLPYIDREAALVDFGCGGGFMLDELVARTKIGIEPNDAAREAAARRGLQVVASPSELGDNFADVIISSHALEHTLSPVDELRQLYRILKPRGKLVLLLPLDDWRAQGNSDPNDVNRHLYTWTPLLLSNLLAESGFTVDSVRIITRAWPPYVKLLRRLLPRPAFDAVAWAWSAATHRRQLWALAAKPSVY